MCDHILSGKEENKMKRKTLSAVLGLALVLGALLIVPRGAAGAQGPEPQDTAGTQAALGTAFTYQGRLLDGGNPANGGYDFVFALYDEPVGGVPVGVSDPEGNVTVSDGFFTVVLNQGNEFGLAAFNGEAHYLEISVRPHGSTDPYVTLSPRRPLTPAPYAIYADRVSSLSASEGGPADVLYVDRKGNFWIGPVATASRPIIFERYEGLGDLADVVTPYSANEYVCGIAGLVALEGEIRDGHEGTIIAVYTFVEDGKWHIRGEFMTDDSDGENWSITLLCAHTAIATWVGETDRID
jgi:hypothetical protein